MIESVLEAITSPLTPPGSRAFESPSLHFGNFRAPFGRRLMVLDQNDIRQASGPLTCGVIRSSLIQASIVKAAVGRAPKTTASRSNDGRHHVVANQRVTTDGLDNL